MRNTRKTIYALIAGMCCYASVALAQIGAITNVGATVTEMDAIAFNTSGTLYGATGGAGSLYTINPATGAATLVHALVGASNASLTYGVNGLAFQPGTGSLYASTSPDSPNSGDGLVAINPATGQVTVIGPTGTGYPYTNIAFAPNGTLYGWLVGSGGATVSAATINLSTGAGTSLGSPQSPNTLPYNGLAINSSGVIVVAANGHIGSCGGSCSGAFWSINPTDGAPTTIATLSGGPGVAAAICALAFAPTTGVLYGIEGGEGGGWNLITINVPTQIPMITLVANAAGGNSAIASNTWVEIKGSNLSKPGDSRTWQPSDFVNGQMPVSLDGVSVVVGGQSAYIYYISPTQVNILTPSDKQAGIVSVQLTNNGVPSQTFSAPSQSVSPSFFLFNGGPYAAVTHADGSYLGPPNLIAGVATTPAQPGETAIFYANGFGPTSTPVISGSGAQSGTLSPLPVITLGGLPAQVQFAGLISPGLFQFNIVIPSGAPGGDNVLEASYNGAAAYPAALIAVQGAAAAPAIAITSAGPTTLDAGDMVTLDAVVTNDPSNAGVLWQISGGPTAPGSGGSASSVSFAPPSTNTTNLTYTVTATAKSFPSLSNSIAILAKALPTVATSGSIPAATVGAAYSATLNGSNGTGPLSWSLAAGSSLPAGLALSPSGVVAGTPLGPAANKVAFSVQVTDSDTPIGRTSSPVTLMININPNPSQIPSITSLSPSLAVAGSPGFTLTVNGANFTSSSAIQWNGNDRTTSFVSATRLSTAITPIDIAAGQNAAISVVDRTAGITSPEVSFSVNTLAPSVASVSPSATAAGSSGFVLTVNGDNFLPASTVQWDGSFGQPPISTTYVSSTELTVAIPASDIAFAGDANVTVLNPAPGGGVSNAAVFTIGGSIPSNVSFVAPNGSDSNPGTIAQPYLTIEHCAGTASNGEVCAIRSGTYRETVTPNPGVTITSYDGEPVTVDGSDPVTGWTLYKGSIYKTTVALSAGDTNQLFVGSQMMTEARWPNGDDLFHGNWATAGPGTTASQLVDPNLPNINWTGAKIHVLSGSDPYSPETGTVTAAAPGQLTFTLDDDINLPDIVPQAGGIYYLYRLLGALDAPGEWFYDSTAAQLYFWAPGSTNPATLNVRAKQRQYCFDLSGMFNVTIQNINLFACAINMNSSSANNTLTGLNVQYVSQYTDLVNPGDFAWFQHSIDTGIILNGSGNVLQNSTIAWSAGNGVALMGSNGKVTNNLIYNTGYAGNDATGIGIFGTGQEFRNNTVHTSGRYGVTVWWQNVNPYNDDISFNNLFNAMMLGPDGGEFYTGGEASGPGTSVHNNWAHDTQPLAGAPAAFNSATRNGLTLDAGASGFEFDQNVLWNNSNLSIAVNGAPEKSADTNPNNNYIHNNTVADLSNAAQPAAIGSDNIWLYNIQNCGSTQVVDNLVFVPVVEISAPCPATNNTSTAPGATQMTSSVQVGCNFAGCSSDGPPAILGTLVAASIAVQPYSMSVAAGQTVTFSATGAGSPPLSYQWQRNGTNITGATGSAYTIPVASAADNGATFTVTVSNGAASVTSRPAVLTVQ